MRHTVSSLQHFATDIENSDGVFGDFQARKSLIIPTYTGVVWKCYSNIGMVIPDRTTALVQELDRGNDSFPILLTPVSISSGSNEISIEIFNDRSKCMHIQHDEILGNLFDVNMVSMYSLSSTSLFDDNNTNEF